MPHPEENLWLHRFAVLTACATFFLIIAGALVTSNDAGLSVPDWPTSYGRLIIPPTWAGGILYEHGHRLIATTVGMLTIVLAVWLQLKDKRRWVKRLGWGALGVVIAQGMLGGMTVLYYLPPAVSISHASLAQLFFCITVTLAVITSSGWKNATPVGTEAGTPIYMFAAGTALAVYVQLLLGAAVRHSVLNVIPHVLGALVVLHMGLFTAVRVWRRYWQIREFRVPGTLLGALVIIQICLGTASYVLVVWRQEVQPLPLTVAVTTAHVAGGAAMLACAVVLALRARVMLNTAPAAEQSAVAA